MTDKTNQRQNDLRELLQEQNRAAKLSYQDALDDLTFGDRSPGVELAGRVSNAVSQLAEGIVGAVGSLDVGHAFRQPARQEEPPALEFNLPVFNEVEPPQQQVVNVEPQNVVEPLVLPDPPEIQQEIFPEIEAVSIPEMQQVMPEPVTQPVVEPPPVPEHQKVRPDFLREEDLPPSFPMKDARIPLPVQEPDVVPEPQQEQEPVQQPVIDVKVPEPPMADPPEPKVMRLDPNQREPFAAENIDIERMSIGEGHATAARDYFEDLLQWQQAQTDQMLLMASQQRELRDRVEQWMPHDVNPIGY